MTGILQMWDIVMRSIGGADIVSLITLAIVLIAAGLALGDVGRIVRVTVSALVVFALLRLVYTVTQGASFMALPATAWSDLKVMPASRLVVLFLVFSIAITVVHQIRNALQSASGLSEVSQHSSAYDDSRWLFIGSVIGGLLLIVFGLMNPQILQEIWSIVVRTVAGADTVSLTIMLVVIVAAGMILGALHRIVQVTVGALTIFAGLRLGYAITQGASFTALPTTAWNDLEVLSVGDLIVRFIIFAIVIGIVHVITNMIGASEGERTEAPSEGDYDDRSGSIAVPVARPLRLLASLPQWVLWLLQGIGGIALAVMGNAAYDGLKALVMQ